MMKNRRKSCLSLSPNWCLSLFLAPSCTSECGGSVHDAVILGVILAALLFAWESSAELRVEVETSPDAQTKTYTAFGPLFFSSDRAFKNYFTISADPPTVIIDLRLCSMRDYSALAAVNAIGLRYASLKKTCVVKVGGEGNLRLLRLFGRRLQNVRLEVETTEPQGLKEK